MMKKCMNLILLCCLILGLSSCRNSEKKKMPDRTTSESIVSFEPIPSFQILISNLEPSKLSGVRYQAITASLKDIQDPIKQAYLQGAKTAQLIIAVKSGDLKTARSLYSDVIRNARISLNEEDKVKYVEQIKAYIDNGTMDKLEKSLDQLKKRIESDLWELKEYELYTITVLGEWCETTRILAGAFESSPGINKAYSENDAWTMIKQNLTQFKRDQFSKSEAVIKSVDKAATLASSMKNAPAGKYDATTIGSITKLCDEIGSLYR